MTTIETVAEIGPDRKLVIALPEEVPQGSHRVMLMLMLLDDHDATAGQPSGSAEGSLEWEGNLLVFNGPVPSDLDIRRMIELSREERMLSVMLGGDG